MAIVRPTQPIRIGECVLDPGLNELRRDDVALRLPPRLVDLLLRLAAEPGLGVRRDTLIDDVWERRQVNDEVLSRAVADLRHALGDDARTPRYIETLPKIGYRLLAAVAPVASPTTPSSPTAAAERVDAPAAVSRPRGRARSPLIAAALIATLVGATVAWWSRAGRDAGDEPVVANPLSAANLLRARPFTTEPGRELFPRFTPDARWVVYTRAGATGEAATLRLRAVDGTDDRLLIGDGVDNYCGAVSPDGATLAWLRSRPGICELVHRALLGGPVRVLAGCGDATLSSCPDWAPDGRSLVLPSGRADAAGLREIAYPDGAERVLTTATDGAHDLMPRHAPRGDRIVFWRGDGWGRALWQLQRDSGAVTPLRTLAFLGFGHAIAADGTLLLADDSFGQRALVRRGADGAAATLLGGSDARYPDIASDGGIVYEVARYDANLWRLDLRDPQAAPRQLTRSARYDSQPAFAPDGAWIAFGSNRDGREGVYLMRGDGSDERKLPLDPALRWTSPTWSPDGTELLVLRYDAHGSRLCRHHLERARTTCFERIGVDRHALFFLGPDQIGMVDSNAEPPRLWRATLAAPAERIDPIGAVDRCRASARWLACHRPGRAGLWLQDRRDAATREILPQLAVENRGAWTLLDDTIWFAAGTGADAGVYRYELVSGDSQRVATLQPSAIGDSISVAPDRSALVIARTDGLETDLMYVPPPPAAAR